MIDSLNISTARLLMRPPTPKDASILQHSLSISMAHLKAWVPFAQHTMSLDEVRLYLDNLCRAWQMPLHDGQPRQLFLFDKSQNIMVGAVTYTPDDVRIPSFSLSFWGHTPYVGKGFVTEGVNALCLYLFEQLQARRIAIMPDAANIKSRNIPLRLGFTLEGRLNGHRLAANGKDITDTLVFAITSAEKLPAIRWHHSGVASAMLVD